MKSVHAQAGAAIRKIIKDRNISAYVRSSTFSMGNAVDVEFTDLSPDVYNELCIELRKFQYGSFDGMTDCYEQDNLNRDLPQVKYVQTSNRPSDVMRQLVWSTMQATDSRLENFDADYKKTQASYIPEFNATISDLVHNLFRNQEFWNKYLGKDKETL